ncbi:hypothetical protein JW848_07445, partial [Candidatus Bipolaricaulota bacterium]|nr:hypothetical protein [Candidatus Bipolaricaulota bacterium]
PESMETLFNDLHVGTASMSELLAGLPALTARFVPATRLPRRKRSLAEAKRDWLMGQLRPDAIGTVPLADLAMAVQEAVR